MRHTFWIALLTGALVWLPAATLATERTGEVLLRELVEGIERDFAALEGETRGFAERAETVAKQLEEKAQAYGRTSNAVRKQVVRADLLALAAEANELDRREVEVTLRTIGEVREKLARIRGVLESQGMAPPKDELPRFRQRLGGWMTIAANLLDGWARRGTPGIQSEIPALKGAMVGAVGAAEASNGQGGVGHDEVTRTLRALDATYAGLLSLSRSLEHERQVLLARNHAAFVELVLTRLSGGKVTVGPVSDTIDLKRRSILRRSGSLNRTNESLAPRTPPGSGAASSELQADFDRIKRGEFRWE